MILAIAAFSTLSGPYLPFPHREERFLPSLVPHVGKLAAERSWRDVLPSDDGKFMLFGRHTYRWTDVRGGDWSNEEAVKIDSSGSPETYTTSQDAHLLRSTTRRLVEYIETVASFSDHAVLSLVGLSPDHREFQYASLIRLDRRGARPNPMLKLRRPLTSGPLKARRGFRTVLTRQGEDTRQPEVLGVIQSREKLTVMRIRFRRSGKRIAAEYGAPISLPSYVHRAPGMPLKDYREGQEFRRPSAVDLRSGKALYCDHRQRRGRGPYFFKLHEYLIRARRWREVAVPPGFDEYGPGADAGMFYWHGRLLFSPQQPNGTPDVRGHIAFARAPGPGSIGLYEAAANRKSWKRIADCQVLSVSASKTAWLVRNPKDDSYWIERMR